MNKWMGLDSGGTEQLWEAEILLDVLNIMKANEPFSRIDPNSPIYAELEEIHPNITWLNVNRDGSQRTAFRKANPMSKLGFTTLETKNTFVTELGNEVLSGALSIRDVFAIAAQNHREPDGTNSFATMCESALILPHHDFSIEDVEFGVSKINELSKASLTEAIDAVRHQRLKLTDSTRRRRIRSSFLKMLVRTEALVETSSGWRLFDEKQATLISQTPAKTSIETGKVPIKPTAKAQRRVFSNVKLHGRQKAPFDLSKSGNTDPIKTAIALERSSQLHEDIVAKLGSSLVDFGFEIFEDPDSFDLAIFSGTSCIFEVKTVNSKNVVAQLRKAIVQLEEYRWRHHELFETSPLLFIALSQNPIAFLDSDYLNFIEEDRQIHLIWPEPDFVDPRGESLPKLLVPPL